MKPSAGDFTPTARMLWLIVLAALASALLIALFFMLNSGGAAALSLNEHSSD